jgi:MOSC domain-containing protein YiiM
MQSFPAQVLQINISPGGLPKRSIAQGIVTPSGLEGDSCAHPHIHGGPLQSLLLIAAEVVDDFRARGFPLFYGALGENITTAGLDHRAWRAGQRYRLGNDIIIEFTKPRGPCTALDVYGEGLRTLIYDEKVKERDPSSRFWGMSGFYASVLRGGEIRPGAPILFLDQSC